MSRGNGDWLDDEAFLSALYRRAEAERMSSDPKHKVSRFTPKTVHHTHAVEITSYMLHKGMGIGNFVRSGTFNVGGYDWAIRVYPDGPSEAFKEHVAFLLELLSNNTQVRASYDLYFFDRASGLKESIFSESAPRMFRSYHGTGLGQRTPAFVERGKLEAACVTDDCLTIHCNLTIAKDNRKRKKKTNSGFGFYVPPSNLSDHFGKLLLDQETADVVFTVEGRLSLRTSWCSPHAPLSSRQSSMAR